MFRNDECPGVDCEDCICSCDYHLMNSDTINRLAELNINENKLLERPLTTYSPEEIHF
jgi:hypothetical protein